MIDTGGKNRFKYSRELMKVWNKGNDIIVLEHDIVITPEQLNELINCPHPNCAFAYELYSVTNDNVTWQISIPGRGSIPLREQPEFAIGTGCNKISKETQAIYPIRQSDFERVCNQLNWISHVHYSVEHDHKREHWLNYNNEWVSQSMR